MKKVIFMFLLIFMLFPSASLSQEKRIKVIAEKANIHIEPDINSTVIETVKKGTILTLFQSEKIRKTWYYVFFYSERRSARVSGFIQDSLVEMMYEEPKIIEEEKKELIEKIKEVIYKPRKKIKVIPEKANIRLQPNFESEIIKQVRIGIILQSVGKAGEWYLINLPPDEEGIIISGYLHQSFAEEVFEKVTEVPKVKEKKPVVTPVPRPKVPVPKKVKFETKSGIAIRAGSAMPSEEKHDSGLEYGANVYLGISKNIAIELNGLYFQSKVEGNPEALSKGKLSVTPIQFGIQARFPVNGKFVPYLVGGGGYYLNNFSLDTEITDTWKDLGCEIQEKVENVMGYYFGAGMDYLFTKNLGLNIDVRYGIAKAKGSWKLTDQITKIELSGDLEGLSLNSLIVGAGLKFCF